MESIRTKIRALIFDLEKSDFETFVYENSKIFTLAESNISSIIKVLKNGAELGSGEYSYDSDTNKIEITVSLTNGDILEIDYKFTKYSNTELNGFITAGLVWISIFGNGETDYEVENDDIFPTPSNKTTDLIALISAILIKPDYTTYKLPTTTVSYSGRIPKEEKIERLISRFNSGLGVNGILKF